MKEIKLSQQGKNKGKYVALVNDEDYEYLNQWRWYAVKDKNTYYAVRHPKGEQDKTLWMHRIIMNTPDNLQVNHLDFNGLNCQRFNMQNCTHRENSIYKKKNKGSSRFLGVSPHTEIHYYKSKITDSIKKYYYNYGFCAAIQTIDKRIFLGYFKTEEEAAIAYDSAAKIHHGNFANLNFK